MQDLFRVTSEINAMRSLEIEASAKLSYKLKEIRELAAYLRFETGSQININEIQKDSEKYSRCHKALNEKNVPRADGQEKIMLEAAFKIENKMMLKQFEKNREQVQEGYGADKTVLLKGLFVKIKKSKLLQTLVFGFN